MHAKRCVPVFLIVLGGVAHVAAMETRDLLIVAGQSNAVGYDAKPSSLPTHLADQEVMFWWKCGDPPPDAHDSSSSQKWSTLQPQPLGQPKERSDGPRQYGNFAQQEGGFGPEIGLARRWTELRQSEKPGTVETRLAIVKVAFSGTNLHTDWDPKAGASTDSGESTRGACYRALIDEVHLAIRAAEKQGVLLRPRALVWVQGESDANQAAALKYAANLQRLLMAIRRDLKAKNLPAMVAVNTKFGGGKNNWMPVVVAQQRLAANRDPACEYVDTSKATIANQAHFDGPGTLQVGRMLADSLWQWTHGKPAASKKAVRLITLGDSITRGVRPGVTADQTFAQRLGAGTPSRKRKIDVQNVGIGGERTDQCLQRLDRVLGDKPDVVTIMYGTNDSYVDAGKQRSRLSVEDYRDNLHQIVARVMAQGAHPILMTPPRWSQRARVNGLGENPNQKLEPYVVACREVAAVWDTPLVDHYADWVQAEKAGQDLHVWTTDGCHPNPKGHARIAELIAGPLQGVLDREFPAKVAP